MNIKRAFLLSFISAVLILLVILAISKHYKANETTAAVLYIEETDLQTYEYDYYKLDINTATAEDLEKLSGVGEKTASAIIEYRDKNGDFKSLEELLEVEGIGESKLNSIREWLVVSSVDTELESTTAVTDISYTDTIVYTEKVTEPDIGSDSEITTEASQSESVFPIDLNSATVEELIQINGIGEATAEKIIAYAKEYGFNSVEDLLNVNGIGEKKLAAMAEYVTVSGGTTIQDFNAENDGEYTPQLPININSATKEDLMWISGIGEVTAEKIIAYANEYGFNSVEDLLNVNGIGEKKLEAMRPYVTV